MRIERSNEIEARSEESGGKAREVIASLRLRSEAMGSSEVFKIEMPPLKPPYAIIESEHARAQIGLSRAVKGVSEAFSFFGTRGRTRTERVGERELERNVDTVIREY